MQPRGHWLGGGGYVCSHRFDNDAAPTLASVVERLAEVGLALDERNRRVRPIPRGAITERRLLLDNRGGRAVKFDRALVLAFRGTTGALTVSAFTDQATKTRLAGL